MFYSKENYPLAKCSSESARTYILGIKLESHDLILADVNVSKEENDIEILLKEVYVLHNHEKYHEEIEQSTIDDLIKFIRTEHLKVESYRKMIFTDYLKKYKCPNCNYHTWLNEKYPSIRMFAVLNVDEETMKYLYEHDTMINFAADDLRAEKVQLAKESNKHKPKFHISKRSA